MKCHNIELIGCSAYVGRSESTASMAISTSLCYTSPEKQEIIIYARFDEVDVQSILNNVQNSGSLALSILSIILSIIALVVTWRAAYTDRINSNSWEIYRTYNSGDIKRGRSIAHKLLRDPAWQRVTNYNSYRAYFHLDTSEEAVLADHEKSLKEGEQSLHDLMAYYHQVGLLLQKKLLDKDFTMLLLGGGLANRWDVLARIPEFYDDRPYSGMYELYETYCKWKEHRLPHLIRKSERASVIEEAQQGTPEKLVEQASKSE